MHTACDSTHHWTWTLVTGLFFLIANVIGVWVSRRVALEVNAIELSAWWYLFAASAPALSVLAAISYPRLHPIWQGNYFFITLTILNLASLVHIPLLYRLGGFE